MKKYIGPVLSIASVGMLFYLVFNQKQQIKELKTTLSTQTEKIQTVDSLTHVIDSLNYEVFNEHINAERYAITLDRLRTEDSLTAAIFETYLHQCE